MEFAGNSRIICYLVIVMTVSPARKSSLFGRIIACARLSDSIVGTY